MVDSPTGSRGRGAERRLVFLCRALRRHLAGFTPEEVASLKRYLDRIIENGQRP
jgi:hypothetical protein